MLLATKINKLNLTTVRPDRVGGIMELTKAQQQIVTTDKSKVLVLSSAASGKSRVITERIKYLLDNGVKPSKIVAITFTNNAAAVMYERLGNPEGLFIGTVHSYANYLLRAGAMDTQKILDEARFDDLFEEIKLNPQCIQTVDYLLLDEAQDSTQQQFEFFELINPKNYMYVGDLKQTIFSFNGSCPDYLINLYYQNDVTVYNLNQNWRNLPDILSFAKKFLYRLGPDYADNSIAMRQSDNKHRYHVVEADYTPEQAVYSLISNKERLGTRWGDWFVLCRTNADVELFQQLFAKQDVLTDTFKQADLTNAEIEQKLREDSVKVLTVHSAKGMQAPCILSYNIRAYNDEEARLCYVAATRARDFLIWAKMPPKKKKRTKMISWE